MSIPIYLHQDIFNCMEKWAPQTLAFEWDSVGLQAGSTQETTKKVLVSLDVTEAVADEAITAGANLIIAHHPLLFKPLKHLDTHSQKGKVIQKLIKHDITVYAAHTNLDIAQGGVNDILSESLQLQHTVPLVKTASETLLKLVAYVPETHTEIVRSGLGDAGAGYIGAYSHCSFITPGTGTFLPGEDTNPYIGQNNEITHVKEDRIETIIREQEKTTIIQKLKELHPYEEIAYDLYPVKQKGEAYGIGRVGFLKETLTLTELCEHVKLAFDVAHLRFVGDSSQHIKKVAILGGSGEKYAMDAIHAGADVLITGDVSFHAAQDAEEMGLGMIDPGHYIEKQMKRAVKNHLIGELSELDVMESQVNTDPFHFM